MWDTLYTQSEDVDVQYGIIICTIVDEEGEPMKDVEVNLSDGQGSVTDDNGRAIFANHAFGNFRVTVVPPSGYECESPSASVTLSKRGSRADVRKVLKKSEEPEESEDPENPEENPGTDGGEEDEGSDDA